MKGKRCLKVVDALEEWGGGEREGEGQRGGGVWVLFVHVQLQHVISASSSASSFQTKVIVAELLGSKAQYLTPGNHLTMKANRHGVIVL